MWELEVKGQSNSFPFLQAIIAIQLETRCRYRFLNVFPLRAKTLVYKSKTYLKQDQDFKNIELLTINAKCRTTSNISSKEPTSLRL